MAVGIDERIARLAVSRGYCAPEQMEDALNALRTARAVGTRAQLAEVLVEKGYVTSRHMRELRRSLVKDGSRRVIAGYEILERVGQGGMGAVYRARQLSLNRIVALKVLSPSLASDKSFVQRFQREARLAARLTHPNLVQVYNVGEHGGRRYIAMEFVEGPSVDKLIELYGRIAEGEAVDIAIGVACALSVAASQGIVHRDVKPSNILLSAEGTVKLTDLGLAKPVGEDDLHITQAGAAVGTPNYMSPEQARGSQQIDGRSDVYSLGATLFHMLTGRPPFEGKTPFDTLRKHVDEPPPSPRDLNPAISRETAEIILRMLAKDPAQRFATPEEAGEALRQLRRRRAQEGPSHLPVGSGVFEGTLAEPGPPAPRRTWLWVVWALATLTLVASGALALSRRARAPATPARPLGQGLRRRPASAPHPLLSQAVQVEWLDAIGESGDGPGQFRGPCAVALGPNGRVYVADRWNHRVQYLDGDGRYLGQWGGPERKTERFREPSALAVTRRGAVWVADTGAARVLRFTGTGLFLTAWGGPGRGAGEMLRPCGLAVTREGMLLVAEEGNGRVQVFDEYGRSLLNMVAEANRKAEWQAPRGVATDPDGTVYVADAERGAVVRILRKGAGLNVRVLELSRQARPVGLCCDARGRVYVTDVRNHCLWVIDGDEAVATWGEGGQGKGALSHPEGVAIGKGGIVYVADTGNDRIVKLRLRFLDATRMAAGKGPKVLQDKTLWPGAKAGPVPK